MVRTGERAQSTVEFAMVLPTLVIVAVLIAQVGLYVRDQSRLGHAARVASRTAIVSPSADAVRSDALATTLLDPNRLTFDIETNGSEGDLVTITTNYEWNVTLPLIGNRLPGIVMTERFVSMIE